jgi:hypothetical protein
MSSSSVGPVRSIVDHASDNIDGSSAALHCDPRFLYSADDFNQQSFLLSSPSLCIYYNTIQRGIHEALVTSAAMASDVFALNSTAPAEALNFAADFVSLPFASAALVLTAKSIDYLSNQRLMLFYRRLRRLNESGDPLAASRLVESVARALALHFKDQLLALPSEDSQPDSTMKTSQIFLYLLQGILCVFPAEGSAESLGCEHCQCLLHYVFSGRLQASSNEPQKLIQELVEVVQNYAKHSKYANVPTNTTTTSSNSVPSSPQKPPKRRNINHDVVDTKACCLLM